MSEADDENENDENCACSVCGGDGADPMNDYLLTCPACGGDGMEDDIMPCEHCDGEGYEWWNA